MLKLFWFSFLLSTFFKIEAQKPVVDSSVYNKWPSLSSPALSNDGRYCFYTIENQPEGNHTLVFASTHSKWKIELLRGFNAQLSQDNSTGYFMNDHDSLGILKLGDTSVKYISFVHSYSLAQRGAHEVLAYILISKDRKLVICDLFTGGQQIFIGVNEFAFSEDGRSIVLHSEEMIDSLSVESIKYIKIDEHVQKIIWKGVGANNLVLDVIGRQLVFSVIGKESNKLKHEYWYYNDTMNNAVLMANDYSSGIDSNLYLGEIEKFSKDGSRIFIRLKEKRKALFVSDNVKVDVWSYKDSKLQSEQLRELDPTYFANILSRFYIGEVFVDDHRIVRLQKENEYIIEKTDDVMLIKQLADNAGGGEYNWNPAWQESWYVLSTQDLKRSHIISTSNSSRDRMKLITSFLSPGGHYVVYFNSELNNYFSYSILKGVTRNITKDILTKWTLDNTFGVTAAIGIAGWMDGDESLLIYDRYDIWQIDMSGKIAPCNITNSYGRRKHLIFRLARNSYPLRAIEKRKELLLCALNDSTKDNGFYLQSLNGLSNPVLLTMSPYLYHWPGIYSFPPIRARDTDMYLIQRMSAAESPNYYSTTDFKVLHPLSEVFPEKAYNWISSELVTWKTNDGKISQGILYKPQDFDSRKKYPIIFQYYERLSDGLNLYHVPAATEDRINIPWFVSHGYLVCSPDIYYKVGVIGKSVVNSIVSIANYLSHNKPWIDSQRMGLQGHSFGGYETNYLITHTSIFAAACSASGISDCISDYGSVCLYGASRQGGYEVGHEGMRVSLWERPDLYIENSPIFKAYKVTTPVLFMSNKEDTQISYTQGVEFFTALRRLGKVSWMLQYDGEDHSLSGQAANDFSIRLEQFFGHYLKDDLAPKWMVEGIPANRKGIDLGFKIVNPLFKE